MLRTSDFFHTAAIALSLGAVGISATAAEITGAGASFPAPIYAKMGRQLPETTGNKVNHQSIGSGGGIRSRLTPRPSISALPTCPPRPMTWKGRPDAVPP